MTVDLRSRRALVTGSSGGIGMAIARALHARGASLVITGRRAEQLEQLRDELGASVEIVVADLSDRAQLESCAQQAGAVDVFISNAALPGTGRVEEYSPAEIDRALDVNLRAPMQLTRVLLPSMLERGWGRLVFISSLAGKVANPMSSIYSATKFGLRGFAFSLHQDLGDTPVDVTTVFPGFISDAGMFADSGTELPAFVGTKTPDDVAAAVIEGIETGRAEIDVAPVAMQVGSRLAALAPKLGATVSSRLGGDRIASDLAEGQRDKR